MGDNFGIKRSWGASRMESPSSPSEIEMVNVNDGPAPMKFALRSRVLIKQEVQTKLKRVEKNVKGYWGIFSFMVFAVLFCTIVSLQKDSDIVSHMDRTIRLALGGAKGAAQQPFQDVNAFWTYMDTKLIPSVYEMSWTQDTGRKELRGYLTNRYNVLLGGVSLKQTRRVPVPCLEDADFVPPETQYACYSSHYGGETADEESSWFSWDSNPVKGQEAFFPSTATAADISALSAHYQKQNLFDSGTKTIELSYIVYNPNFRAVALVRHDFKMDFTGRLFGSLRVTTLPYDCYATWQQHIRGVLEVVFVVLSCLMFNRWQRSIRWTYPNLFPECLALKGDVGGDLAVPIANDGRSYLTVPLAMFTLLAVEVVLWLRIQLAYVTLHTAANTGATSNYFDSAADPALMEARISAVWSSIESLAELLNTYMFVAGVLSLVMCFRMLEYLHFQKKLAVITETFAASFNEMIHLFMVLAGTVNFFALTSLLVFGSQVKAFSDFSSSLRNTWQMVFGLWKPSRVQERYESLEAFELYLFMFKLVITLLLLKMVLAVVFESYKTVAGKQSKQTKSVGSDIDELVWTLLDWIGNWRESSSYISPEQIKTITKDAQSLSWIDIVDQLNTHFPGENGHATYHMGHAEWVLNRYGSDDDGQAVSQDGSTPAPSQKEMAKIIETFESFDADKSGEIDREEMGAAMIAMGYPPMTAEELETQIMTVDTDGSGELDLDEFCVMLTGYNSDGTKFYLPGMEGDNARLNAELAAVATYAANINMAKLDVNGDGIVDAEEFQAIIPDSMKAQVAQLQAERKKLSKSSYGSMSDSAPAESPSKQF